jgi:hypothetical protein
MRSAHHKRLFSAIVLIKATVSAANLDFLEAGFDRFLQDQRNKWRCHFRRVSGWTMKSVCFHL